MACHHCGWNGTAGGIAVTTLAKAALDYARRGWPVLPIRPGTKAPALGAAHAEGDPRRGVCHGECGREGHGVHDATSDPATIERWWRRWPDANIGIATGAPGPDVLDVDVKDGRPGLESFERLRQAGLLRGAHRLVRTPSGGLHVYFAGTGRAGGACGEGRCIELKACGGYVLAPPSVAGGRAYEVLDERPETGAVLDWDAIVRLLAPPAPPAPPVTRHASGGRLIAPLVRLVEHADKGNRNRALFWAACRAVETGLDPTPLIAAAVAAGLPDHEAATTVRSAQRRAGGVLR